MRTMKLRMSNSPKIHILKLKPHLDFCSKKILQGYTLPGVPMKALTPCMGLLALAVNKLSWTIGRISTGLSIMSDRSNPAVNKLSWTIGRTSTGLSIMSDRSNPAVNKLSWTIGRTSTGLSIMSDRRNPVVKKLSWTIGRTSTGLCILSDRRNLDFFGNYK